MFVFIGNTDTIVMSGLKLQQAGSLLNIKIRNNKKLIVWVDVSCQNLSAITFKLCLINMLYLA